jgi:hypothetical protein
MRYNPTISVNDHHRGDNKHRIDAGYATYFDVPFIIQKINDACNETLIAHRFILK